MYRVIITGPAKRDIQEAHDWWAEHRSAEQAERWYFGIRDAIRSLRDAPESSPLATETDLLAQEIRQRQFGLGRHSTHRIVFAIDGTTVVILRVRHAAQDALTLEELDR